MSGYIVRWNKEKWIDGGEFRVYKSRGIGDSWFEIKEIGGYGEYEDGYRYFVVYFIRNNKDKIAIGDAGDISKAKQMVQEWVFKGNI